MTREELDAIEALANAATLSTLREPLLDVCRELRRLQAPPEGLGNPVAMAYEWSDGKYDDEPDSVVALLNARDAQWQHHIAAEREARAKAERERGAAHQEVCDLLASAVPHPVEYPTMVAAWERAAAFLLRVGKDSLR